MITLALKYLQYLNKIGHLPIALLLNLFKTRLIAAKSFQDSIDIKSFEVIITDSYSYLIDNKGITFGECEIKDDRILQEVTVISNEDKSELSYRLSAVDEKLGVEAANLVEQLPTLST